MAGILAFILPVDQGLAPTHPIAPGGPPLGFWGGTAPPWVSHPIAPGGPEVTHPIAPGGPPPGIWPSPGHPAHPIAPGFPPGYQPPGIWGGGNVPYPTPPIYIPVPPPAGSPHPEHPIYIPVIPAHPIVIPPGTPPEQALEQIKAKLEQLFGNLPENPNPVPTPV
jgi:hypothetical protein